MTPEEIIAKLPLLGEVNSIEDLYKQCDKFKDPYLLFYYSEVLTAMKEYARQERIKERDRALDWAAKNARTEQDWVDIDQEFETIVDRSSIIAGKTHKDLEI